MDRCVRTIFFVCLFLLIPMTLSCLYHNPDPHREVNQALMDNNDPNNPVVFLGTFGNTYHNENCPYLRLDKYPIRLQDAQRFYKPCLQCKPVE